MELLIYLFTDKPESLPLVVKSVTTFVITKVVKISVPEYMLYRLRRVKNVMYVAMNEWNETKLTGKLRFKLLDTL